MSPVLQAGGIEIEICAWDDIFFNLIPEIEGAYDFDSIPFEKGDVVLDIGAHQGIVSIYLAKRWPGMRIYAFEPIPENYERLLANIELNKVKSAVKAYPLAVAAQSRDFPMRRGNHSAEATGFFLGDSPEHIALSTTMPLILRQHRIDRVRLLKLDCEGAEHEILADSNDWIDRIDYLRGEIHMIPMLRDAGYTAEATMGRFPADRAAWQIIPWAAQL